MLSSFTLRTVPTWVVAVWRNRVIRTNPTAAHSARCSRPDRKPDSILSNEQAIKADRPHTLINHRRKDATRWYLYDAPLPLSFLGERTTASNAAAKLSRLALSESVSKAVSSSASKNAAFVRWAVTGSTVVDAKSVSGNCRPPRSTDGIITPIAPAGRILFRQALGVPCGTTRCQNRSWHDPVRACPE